MKHNLPTLIVLFTFTGLAVSLLDPHFPQDQLLQHIPTLPSMLVILYGTRKGWWSLSAVVCLMIFAWLHILGARFVYSCVPYDEWSRQLFGISISESFGWKRNHFDRFVHLIFGAVMLLPVAEIFLLRGIRNLTDNLFISFCFLTAVSCVYEILEWGAAVVMSPDRAEAYNGQQGDSWDAQKDMALACLGTLLAIPPVILRLRGTSQQKSFPAETTGKL